ncbi:type II secretion system F family protein [Pseudoduganella umbonata]|uniref:Tight adherence protein B n=1 Tax=Pseudoduganella umbonata TaxID=864828 RepID=A0A4P8HSH2_9BURK|nr:type II secretion system F family protein [Pseudoduganella umbonata]MBB3223774.1 tight adherence protein B [Pseudoduganella umbonata]QCP12803.1 type II secretion system F family protein [Pseudoduganella umbonata]
MDMLFTAFTVLVFAAVIFMVEGAWMWWGTSHGRSARRIAHRLDLMSGRAEGGERISILKQRRYAASPGLELWLRSIPQLALLDRLLLQAGGRWQVGQFLAWSCALPCFALLLLPALKLPLLPACVLMAGVIGGPYALLLRTRNKRMRKIEGQLPEAADFLARALRAGHSFANVLKMVGDEIPEPIGGEFKVAYEEINYGAPMNEALHNLAARIPLTDLRYLVLAVLIQRESGGNLAELLGNVGRLTRARLKLQGQIRVLSAEGRMSAWVLGLLPFAMLLFMSLTNYSYISLLWTDPLGIRMLWFGGGAMALGAFWMRNVVRIRV